MAEITAFNINLKLGNAEFNDTEHVAAALEKAAESLRDGFLNMNILDANGNSVGSYKAEAVDEDQ